MSVSLRAWQKHRRTAAEGAGKCKHIWKGTCTEEEKYTDARRRIHRQPQP